MRIVYDASVLGLGYHIPAARTGVFRVTENIAYGLAASKECDLVLCAARKEAEAGLFDYLRSNPRLSRVPLRARTFSKLAYGLTDSLSYRGTSPRLGQLHARTLGRLLGYASRSIRTRARDVDSHFADADIFHSTFFPFPPAVKRAASVKKFLTIYDLIPILYPHFFEGNASVKQLIEETLGSLDRRDFLLCISEATKNDLCNYAKNVDPAKIFVTHLAASELFRRCTDLERTAAVRCKYGIPQHAPYLLSVGTLEPRKNMDQVIRCFAKVVQEQNLDGLHLVLVGTKGWEYGKIYKAISDYECLKTRIILTGYVDDDDLSPLYSGALAFIYVSLYEGFGLPPLEAMQCGTPVITSNTSSLPEVVGKAAIMLDPMDTDGICQNMLKLYQNEALRAEMSQKSLDQARQFSWEKCTRETIAAYRTALSR